MSSPEGINYHKEQDINTSIRKAKFVLNQYYRLAVTSIVFMGLSTVVNFKERDVTNSEHLLAAGLIGLAISTVCIIDVKQKIGQMNKLNTLKAREQKFYRSFSRHNPNVNHLS